MSFLCSVRDDFQVTLLRFSGGAVVFTLSERTNFNQQFSGISFGLFHPTLLDFTGCLGYIMFRLTKKCRNHSTWLVS